MDGIAGDILKEGELKSVVIFSYCFSSEVFIVQTLAIKLLHRGKMSPKERDQKVNWEERGAKNLTKGKEEERRKLPA